MRADREKLVELLRRTRQAIAAESTLPRSPGVMQGERPILCTGAAFVYQTAVMAAGRRDPEEVAHTMLRGGKAQILREAEALDLDPRFVESLVLNSEAFGDHERREKVLQMLSEIAAEADRAATASG